jgi:hypothetical protein
LRHESIITINLNQFITHMSTFPTHISMWGEIRNVKK